MPSSFEIDVEVNLKPPSKAKIKKQLGDIDVSAFFGRMDTAGIKPGMLDKLLNIDIGISTNILKGILTGIGILTGVFGILKKVPSILQASLKLMGIGFLLILKPMADLIGMLLMPIAKAMISLAMFLNKFKAGAGVGGLVGVIIGALVISLIALFAGLSTSGLIVLAVVAGVVILVAGIIGSVLGAIAEYAWGELVNIEKGTIGTILVDTFKEKLDPDGFWGKIIGAVENWVSDKKDKRGFFKVILDQILGGEGRTGAITRMGLSTGVGAAAGGAAGSVVPGLGTVVGGVIGGIVGLIGGILTEKDKFATGGIITSPTRALIGEAGPEAVIPLNQLGSFGGTTININGIVDEYKFRDIIRDVVRQENTAHYGVTGGSI